MKFTVFGNKGFIGRHLTNHLSTHGYEVNGISRHNFFIPTESLGHVFYCIGMTANFRENPYATTEAHVCLLKKIFEDGTFDSFTYLSSTRVYQGSKETHETAALEVIPTEPDYIYNISKIMGESFCANNKAKIVRLSNIFGKGMPPSTFLFQILSDAIKKNEVKFLTSAASTKDYLSIDDVVRWLPEIALRGKHTIYNMAYGKNISNHELSEILKSIGAKTSFQQNAPEFCFKEIDSSRLHREFGLPRERPHSSILALINSIKTKSN